MCVGVLLFLHVLSMPVPIVMFKLLTVDLMNLNETASPNSIVSPDGLELEASSCFGISSILSQQLGAPGHHLSCFTYRSEV